MKNVVISESLFKAMMEQLGYWADYCDDSEGYLKDLLSDVNENAKENAVALSVVHELICEKEGYDCDDEQSDALEIIF
ncbi:hypothetical protein FDJ20_gp186 [Vibrio phage Thalassa]|uniref:Uncharacterized protein n=1 Tax=Vibrio phage Thalassa TaxID=2570301 RepID=A0A2H5BH55_9CAUD|nr:hypothetical protein FDJ20_gp186 [Vibrio phage Thalassa]AUG85316.1 hypothetical protein THALASSA_133 [Vibrio phage Thalassa]